MPSRLLVAPNGGYANHLRKGLRAQPLTSPHLLHNTERTPLRFPTSTACGMTGIVLTLDKHGRRRITPPARITAPCRVDITAQPCGTGKPLTVSCIHGRFYTNFPLGFVVSSLWANRSWTSGLAQGNLSSVFGTIFYQSLLPFWYHIAARSSTEAVTL